METKMSAQIPVERFKKALFGCLDETFSSVHGIYLDKGTTLFETLEGVSAEEASRAISGNSATVADFGEIARDASAADTTSRVSNNVVPLSR